MIISLIVARDEMGGIGRKNRLPWYIPSDLKRFKALTMGHHLVMGRKTYETIGKPLPGRTMIIITRRKDYQPEGCLIASSLKNALDIAEVNNETEAFVIGGGQIFTQAMNVADKIYLTNVHAVTEADVFFPEIDDTSWETVYSESVIPHEKDEYTSEFKILERIIPMEFPRVIRL